MISSTKSAGRTILRLIHPAWKESVTKVYCSLSHVFRFAFWIGQEVAARDHWDHAEQRHPNLIRIRE
jgi:hypothetical protein